MLTTVVNYLDDRENFQLRDVNLQEFSNRDEIHLNNDLEVFQSLGLKYLIIPN